MKPWNKLLGGKQGKGNPSPVAVLPQQLPSSPPLTDAPASGSGPFVDCTPRDEDDSIEDEFRRGMQEVREMREKYEGLLSLASKAQQKSTDLSESLHQLSVYVDSAFGSMKEGDIGTVFSQVAAAQEGIAQLFSTFGGHVGETIVGPTRSLLLELTQVEETKVLYEDKRQAYAQLLQAAKARHRQKRRSFDGASGSEGAGAVLTEGEDEWPHGAEALHAKEEFDEVAMTLGCRILNLDQQRPRRLLTQALRYLTAKRRLFRQGADQLVHLDPLVRQLMHQLHTTEKQILEGLLGADSKAEETVSLGAKTSAKGAGSQPSRRVESSAQSTTAQAAVPKRPGLSVLSDPPVLSPNAPKKSFISHSAPLGPGSAPSALTDHHTQHLVAHVLPTSPSDLSAQHPLPQAVRAAHAPSMLKLQGGGRNTGVEGGTVSTSAPIPSTGHEGQPAQVAQVPGTSQGLHTMSGPIPSSQPLFPIRGKNPIAPFSVHLSGPLPSPSAVEHGHSLPAPTPGGTSPVASSASSQHEAAAMRLPEDRSSQSPSAIHQTNQTLQPRSPSISGPITFSSSFYTDFVGAGASKGVPLRGMTTDDVSKGEGGLKWREGVAGAVPKSASDLRSTGPLDQGFGAMEEGLMQRRRPLSGPIPQGAAGLLLTGGGISGGAFGGRPSFLQQSQQQQSHSVISDVILKPGAELHRLPSPPLPTCLPSRKTALGSRGALTAKGCGTEDEYDRPAERAESLNSTFKPSTPPGKRLGVLTSADGRSPTTGAVPLKQRGQGGAGGLTQPTVGTTGGTLVGPPNLAPLSAANLRQQQHQVALQQVLQQRVHLAPLPSPPLSQQGGRQGLSQIGPVTAGNPRAMLGRAGLGVSRNPSVPTIYSEGSDDGDGSSFADSPSISSASSPGPANEDLPPLPTPSPTVPDHDTLPVRQPLRSPLPGVKATAPKAHPLPPSSSLAASAQPRRHSSAPEVQPSAAMAATVRQFRSFSEAPGGGDPAYVATVKSKAPVHALLSPQVVQSGSFKLPSPVESVAKQTSEPQQRHHQIESLLGSGESGVELPHVGTKSN